MLTTDAPAIYEIRVRGRLDPRWADWFDGLIIDTCAEETLLRGPVVDQAALHGHLARVRDMGLELIALTLLVPAETAQ